MNLLYLILGNGYGRPVDMDAAMAWLERAVAAGDIGARFNFATMLYEGRPWLAHRGRACRMFTDFADVEGAGAVSLYYLGWATMRGECGLDKDVQKAAQWIGRAAEGNVRDAARDYARLLETAWVSMPTSPRHCSGTSARPTVATATRSGARGRLLPACHRQLVGWVEPKAIPIAI